MIKEWSPLVCDTQTYIVEKPSALHNDLNVIQSIFIGKLLFIENGQHRERDSRSPHMPNIFISQLRSLNGPLLSRGVIIFLSHPGAGLRGDGVVLWRHLL